MTAGSTRLFSTLFCLVYVTLYFGNWVPFRYYPAVRAFHVGLSANDGPAMAWYGWLTAAAVSSALVTWVVPARLAEKTGVNIAWILPLTMIVVMLLQEAMHLR